MEIGWLARMPLGGVGVGEEDCHRVTEDTEFGVRIQKERRDLPQSHGGRRESGITQRRRVRREEGTSAARKASGVMLKTLPWQLIWIRR